MRRKRKRRKTFNGDRRHICERQKSVRKRRSSAAAAGYDDCSFQRQLSFNPNWPESTRRVSPTILTLLCLAVILLASVKSENCDPQRRNESEEKLTYEIKTNQRLSSETIQETIVGESSISGTKKSPADGYNLHGNCSTSGEYRRTRAC